jgi:hypothetical protein
MKCRALHPCPVQRSALVCRASSSPALACSAGGGGSGRRNPRPDRSQRADMQSPGHAPGFRSRMSGCGTLRHSAVAQQVARIERPRLRSLCELRRVPRERVRQSAEREGRSEMRDSSFPDVAEPVLGLAEGETRGLHPGSGPRSGLRSRSKPHVAQLLGIAGQIDRGDAAVAVVDRHGIDRAVGLAQHETCEAVDGRAPNIERQE